VEHETRVDPGRNPKGENRDAEGKRPQRDFKRKRAAYKMAIKDAKVGSLRNALKQGNPEDPGGLAYRLITSKKRGAAATAWATIQDEEGIWAGNRNGSHSEVLPGGRPDSDTDANRETRVRELEWSGEQDKEITLQKLKRTVQEKPKKKAPGIDGFPTAGLEHLLEAVGGKIMAGAHKVRGVAGRTWGTDPRTRGRDPMRPGARKEGGQREMEKMADGLRRGIPLPSDWTDQG
jgi:hypothetical protein